MRYVSLSLLDVYYPSGSCNFGFQPLQSNTSFTTLQAELRSQVFPQRGLATETDVLCADYWLAFPELSRLLKFPESPCAMVTNGIS